MDLKTVKLSDDSQGSFEIKTIGGKTAFVFDSAPSLLFLSLDGTGRTSYVFSNGEHIADFQSVQINARVDEIANFTIEKVAVTKIVKL